jgi:predicted nucleic acid-binding protein
MYFLDANIFLELQLDQQRADPCDLFLRKIQRGQIKAVTTDFHMDTIILIMEKYGKSPADLRLFISCLIGFEGLRIYFLSLTDRLKAIRRMEEFKLDYDDALAYQVMAKLNIHNVVSYDKHFDHISNVTRQEPTQLV